MSVILKSIELLIPEVVILACITWYDSFSLNVKTTKIQVDWKDTWEKYEYFDFERHYEAIHDIKNWKIVDGDIFFKVQTTLPTSTLLWNFFSGFVARILVT